MFSPLELTASDADKKLERIVKKYLEHKKVRNNGDSVQSNQRVICIKITLNGLGQETFLKLVLGILIHRKVLIPFHCCTCGIKLKHWSLSVHEMD